jgi:hypothetical protein
MKKCIYIQRHTHMHTYRHGHTHSHTHLQKRGTCLCPLILMIHRSGDLRLGTLSAFHSELEDNISSGLRLHLLLLESQGALSLMYGRTEWPSLSLPHTHTHTHSDAHGHTHKLWRTWPHTHKHTIISHIHSHFKESYLHQTCLYP